MSTLFAFYLPLRHSEWRRMPVLRWLSLFQACWWMLYGLLQGDTVQSTARHPCKRRMRMFCPHPSRKIVRYLSCAISRLWCLDSSCFRPPWMAQVPNCGRIKQPLLIESQFSKWCTVGMFKSCGLACRPFIFHHVFYWQCSYQGNW